MSKFAEIFEGKLSAHDYSSEHTCKLNADATALKHDSNHAHSRGLDVSKHGFPSADELLSSMQHAVESGARQVSTQVAHAVSELDKNSTVHRVTHDVCDENPVKIAALGTAVLGATVVAGVVMAPEAMLAAGIGAPVAGAAGVLAVFGATGLKIDYDSRTHR